MGIFDKFFRRKATESKFIEKEASVINSKNKRGHITTYKTQLDCVAVKELKKRYIAFDVETSGLNPMNDRIVEVGAVLFEKGEIIKRYSTLVNSETFIPQNVTAINHNTNEMVNDAPREFEVYAELVDFLGDALSRKTALCAHNATFDMNFLSETLMRLGYDGEICYVDTLSLSRNLIKGLCNYKQDTVAMHFDILNNQSH